MLNVIKVKFLGGEARQFGGGGSFPPPRMKPCYDVNIIIMWEQVQCRWQLHVLVAYFQVSIITMHSYHILCVRMYMHIMVYTLYSPVADPGSLEGGF